MEEKQVITEQEAQFCLLYTNAPAPLAGDARKCYQKVFPEVKDEAEAQYLAMEMMRKPCVKARIEDLESLNVYDTDALKAKITSTLIKIMDECAEGTTVDRFGKKLSPAAMRSVSVHAAKTLNDMYGIREAIETKVKLEGTDGQGIVFNINVPQPQKDEEEFDA